MDGQVTNHETGVEQVPAAGGQTNQNQGQQTQQAATQGNQQQTAAHAASQQQGQQQPPQAIPYERFQEVNNKVKELEQQIQLSQQQIALYQANMQQQAQAQRPQMPNFYEGLEDDDVMTVAEAKKATQAMVQQFSSAINELQFLVQHPDYHQLVGTPQQLGEPLKQAILKNPQIMMEIRQSPNPMLTAYNYAKMASMQQQTTVNPAAAAAIQAATRPGSASMVANGGAFNAASRFAAMSDEEFARFEAEILSRG